MNFNSQSVECNLVIHLELYIKLIQDLDITVSLHYSLTFVAV